MASLVYRCFHEIFLCSAKHNTLTHHIVYTRYPLSYTQTTLKMRPLAILYTVPFECDGGQLQKTPDLYRHAHGSHGNHSIRN